MELKEQFEAAAIRSKELKNRPSNEDLLELYSWYKQATDGDINDERPGGFDFKAIAKYDAWDEKKGKSKDEAMKEYIQLVDRLQQQDN